jgi:hypothetical protein
MEMTGKERSIWLQQIKRIHTEQKEQRDSEAAAQLNYLMENNSGEMM